MFIVVVVVVVTIFFLFSYKTIILLLLLLLLCLSLSLCVLLLLRYYTPDATILHFRSRTLPRNPRTGLEFCSCLLSSPRFGRTRLRVYAESGVSFFVVVVAVVVGLSSLLPDDDDGGGRRRRRRQSTPRPRSPPQSRASLGLLLRRSFAIERTFVSVSSASVVGVSVVPCLASARTAPKRTLSSRLYRQRRLSYY